MKYDVQFTNQFKKDLKLAKKQHKNLDKLFEVVETLANGSTLEAKYRDHNLTGNYKGTRECHIEPDWLLVYEIYNDILVLILTRLGTHSKLSANTVQHTLLPPKTPFICKPLSLQRIKRNRKMNHRGLK